MAFDNVRSILSLGSPLSSLKLLCVAASFSRPKYHAMWHAMLRPFVHNDEVNLRYRCGTRYQMAYLRMPELQSDFQSALELCARDTYHLDEGFHPDLVIDGGGNIGFFTMRVAALEASVGRKPRFVIYEPMPHNSAQCLRHLKSNGIEAEMVNACRGGTRRSIPFYCREANSSSFDRTKPYSKVIEMPVDLLSDAIGDFSAERILIKLDIEGMEVEALGALLPCERRAVYVVGELHDASINLPKLKHIFEEDGWSYHIGNITDDLGVFRACSPAALPHLSSFRERMPSGLAA